MLNNQAVRTILVAVVFISTALFVMRFFEGRDSLASDDEFAPPPVIHVAEEPQPTIVPPKDDWMNDHVDDANPQPTLIQEHEDTAFLGPPVSVDGEDNRTIRR